VGEDEGGRHPPPTIYPLLVLVHIHIRARADPRTRVRTRTQSCGRSLLRTRGDNKICDNQPQRRRRRRESVMTLSRTSFQATSVTLRAHLPLSRVLPILFPSSTPFLRDAYLYLYPDFYIYLYLYLRLSTSISIFISDSLSRSLSLSLRRSLTCPTHRLVIPFSSFLFSPLRMYFERGSYSVSRPPSQHDSSTICPDC